MNCVPFAPELLSDLSALINSHVAPISPGWTLSEAQIAATLASAPHLWDIHYAEGTVVFESETLCVLDQGSLVAAGQWGYPVQRGTSGHADQSLVGLLFWAMAESDNAGSLRLLLETLATRSDDVRCCKVTTSRFTFGVGWLGIPATWLHIIEGLQAGGFAVNRRWTVLTGSANAPHVVPPPHLSSMRIAWQVDTAALEWELQLLAGDALAGECHAWGIPPHLAQCDGSTDWVTIEWLGVEPVHQRLGIGRWLLSEQLRRQAERGVTDAMLWIELENDAARRLSESLGFQRSFECWEFEKIIE